MNYFILFFNKKSLARIHLCVLALISALWGCKPKELLPSTAIDTVPAETLLKIQAWYNPKIERLRSQKSSPQSIYLPQWGEGKLEILPTGGRIAYFPAHREAKVQYHNIGFVRRFVVRLDAQDNVLEAKLLEMIGRKEYLHAQKNEVVKHFYRQDMQGIKAVAWERSLNFATNKIGMMSTCEPIIVYKTFEDGCSSIVTIYCDGSKSESTPICGGYFNPIDGDGLVDTGGGTSGEGSGNGGTVSTPCPLCVNYDEGDNTTPPPNVSQELLKITKNWNLSNFTPAQWSAVDAVLQKGLTNPYLRKMYDEIALNAAKYPSYKLNMETFVTSDDPNEEESLGKYKDEYFYENNAYSKGIKLNTKLFGNDPQYTGQFMVTFWAEMTHAYQNTVYQGEYKDLKEKLNIETEQRFFIEFVEHMSRTPSTKTGILNISKGYSFYGSQKNQAQLEAWLEAIKNSPEGKPTLANTSQQYLAFFMPKFKEVWKDTKYGQMDILPNEILYAILFLF